MYLSRRVGVGAARAGGIVAPKEPRVKATFTEIQHWRPNISPLPQRTGRAPTLLAHAVHRSVLNSNQYTHNGVFRKQRYIDDPIIQSCMIKTST